MEMCIKKKNNFNVGLHYVCIVNLFNFQKQFWKIPDVVETSKNIMFLKNGSYARLAFLIVL